ATSEDPIARVARDDVARSVRGSADDVARGIVDPHTLGPISQGASPGGIGADVIAEHLITGAPNAHTRSEVARDDVAGRGARAPDGIGCSADLDPDLAVGQRTGAGRVGPDEVPLHGDAG